MSDYSEEFGCAFRNFAVARLRAASVDPHAQAAHVAHVERLTGLYGEEVLPKALLQCYCLSLEEPCYCCPDPDAVDVKVLRGEFWRALHKRVLIVDEHPTLSRCNAPIDRKLPYTARRVHRADHPAKEGATETPPRREGVLG